MAPGESAVCGMAIELILICLVALRSQVHVTVYPKLSVQTESVDIGSCLAAYVW